MKFKSKANNNNDLVAGTVTVNNFFAHWIREINIVRYGDEKPIFLTTNMVDVYRYLDELLKHAKGRLDYNRKQFTLLLKKSYFSRWTR